MAEQGKVMILTNPAEYAKLVGNIVTIIIPWKPVPKARPRMTRTGHCYDPQEKEKQRDRKFLLWCVAGVPKIRILMARGCVKNVTMYFVLSIPKSTSQKKRDVLKGKPHDKKPDGSNLLKWTEDVGNGILWRDDAVLSSVMWSKIWGEEPKTIIEIEYENTSKIG
jgi:Holliday junction resolvase RusA-like endonuclease